MQREAERFLKYLKLTILYKQTNKNWIYRYNLKVTSMCSQNRSTYVGWEKELYKIRSQQFWHVFQFLNCFFLSLAYSKYLWNNQVISYVSKEGKKEKEAACILVNIKKIVGLNRLE